MGAATLQEVAVNMKALLLLIVVCFSICWFKDPLKLNQLKPPANPTAQSDSSADEPLIRWRRRQLLSTYERGHTFKDKMASDSPRTSGNSSHQSPGASKKKKPTLYFHVGPPKTATTFLQMSFCGDTTAEALLLQDNFVYLGTCPTNFKLHHIPGDKYMIHTTKSFWNRRRMAPTIPNANLIKMMLTGGARSATATGANRSLANHFKRVVLKAKEQGRDALVIFEAASEWGSRRAKVMADALQQDFEVEIFIGYRPLYQWLPSWINQHIKRRPGEDGYDMEDKGKLYVDWSSTSNDPPLFDRLLKAMRQHHLHPTQIIKQDYQQFFDNVQIVPYNHLPTPKGSGDPLLEYFVCRFLNNASHTCNAAKKGELGASETNPSVPIQYGLLAAGAARRLVVAKPASIIRPDKLVEKIQYHQKHVLNRTDIDFPLSCPPKTVVEQFRNLSLLMEKSVFGDSWTNETEAKHRSGFQSYLDRRKIFCVVNVDETLEQPEWSAFFRKVFRLN